MLSFDVTSYLQDRGIEYDEEGKNTTPGWVEVNCPFCGDDPSTHLGISPERLLNCWRCGTRGSVIKYVMTMERCSFYDAKKIVEEEFIDETLKHLHQDKEEVIKNQKVIFPTMKTLNSDHLKYLEKRGFDPYEIERKYKLSATGRCIGDNKKYSYRIIIPVYVNHMPVSFTAMDYTDTRQRYIHSDNSRSAINMKNVLYNVDTVRDTVVVVEGVTDCWKIGDSCVATMGNVVTTHQILFLVRRKVQRCFVLFDSEVQAQKNAKITAEKLSGMIPYVETCELEGINDPGELSLKEAKELRKKLRI